MIGLVVTKEQLENHSRISHNYFRLPKKGEYDSRIKGRNPLGKHVVYEDAFLFTDPDIFQSRTTGYFIDETTPDCNLGCYTCFNGSDKIRFDPLKLRYGDVTFHKKLSVTVNRGTYRGSCKMRCISGGEPTIDMKKLTEISNAFTEDENKTTVVIATNTTVLPLDKNEIESIFSQFNPRVEWQFSYNIPLRKQYEMHLGEKTQFYQIPNAEDPLLEKIRIVKEVADSLGINNMIRLTRRKNLDGRLLDYVRKELGGHVYPSTINGPLHKKHMRWTGDMMTILPPRHASMYMTADGRAYPSMHFVGDPKMQLGFICDVN